MLPWKNLLLAVLGIVLPMIFSWLVGQFPGLPIGEAQFVEMALYFVGLLVGGWQLNAARIVYGVENNSVAKVSKFIMVKKDHNASLR